MTVDEASIIAPSITNWEDLTTWLDTQKHQETTPPPNRTPLGTPVLETSWKAALRRRFFDMKEQGEPVGEEPVWPKVVERRRRISLLVSAALTLLLTSLASEMISVQHTQEEVAVAYIVLLTIMNFFMINAFSKTLIGTWHALKGPIGNPWHPKHTETDPRPDSKVAIVFPVYHEDPHRVVAGMIAVAQSLQTNVPEDFHHYEFFLLSDSRNPAYRIAEVAAIDQARLACPQMKFHYRWRISNDNAKLGNMTDFCRRWGRDYDYMLAMDADSIMNGDTIHQLLRMMEGNHRLGILQTNPTPVMRKSLFGRMQQFAGRLYGSSFSYALQAMYMGHANYIGHNALIRTRPFMEHCLLPDLPGSKPWGGKPLSHDIVEAALMARAGYEVWFLPDLGGTYEEIPANILSFLIRERRWMQGNLQHTRLLFVDGLHKTHRENFITGFMGYLSAFFWGIFLIISAGSMVNFLKAGKFSQKEIGSIEIPAVMMLIASIVFMLAPRFLAVIKTAKEKKAGEYGGLPKMAFCIFIETAFSFLFSPLMMVFITKFLWVWAKRRSISWGTQQRDDEALPWSACIKNFSWSSGIGIIASTVLFWEIMSIPAQTEALLSMASGHSISTVSLFLWFSPILAGLSGSVVIARFTSRSFPVLEKMKWFMIPEETNVPQELIDTKIWQEKLAKSTPSPEDEVATFSYALRDPCFYVAQRARSRRRPFLEREIRRKMEGQNTLTLKELMLALYETGCLDILHRSAISEKEAA
ncbi:glucans biosynthesis glucosyltransferase MdoH [Acetobacter malorum]|nr:glucans biosynthesis glucosyltransferase MdoH [Acetobacter malorum]